MNSSGDRRKEPSKAPARSATEFEEYTRAMLNILEDFAAEKERMEETQKAMLNILDDFDHEKTGAEENQKAMLNILDDFAVEKTGAEDNQKAMLNILDDFTIEKTGAEENQSAMLNILDDFAVEKAGAEETQRAMLNILDDFDVEKMKSEAANRDLQEAFDSLRRAKGAADAANRELEAFSYSVSHDLRAPLRHIKGFVELLKEDAGPSLNEDSRESLDTISGAASKMGNLIDDLLSFSRMGRADMRKKKIELDKLVNEVISEMSKETGEAGITWKVDALPVVYGDPAMLKLTLVNLISNAVKFTRHTAGPIIEVGSFTSDEGDTVIFVKDNGAGFDMQYIDKLFGVFQRLHKPEDFEGTGIGLANVRRIITRHGGKTWAEGAVGKGATFYFSLPKFMPEE
ncbi:MAG: ATP-binding protein [Nitrospirota bacterium]